MEQLDASMEAQQVLEQTVGSACATTTTVMVLKEEDACLGTLSY